MTDATTFEWNDDKAVTNWIKHGVSFQQAIGAFRDPFAIEWLDEREDYGEERINLLGRYGDVMLYVTYTERGDHIRIISARRAEKHEQENYYGKNVP
jgi:uncharacterized DUF497 family protein